jgi:hypothetical protein
MAASNGWSRCWPTGSPSGVTRSPCSPHQALRPRPSWSRPWERSLLKGSSVTLGTRPPMPSRPMTARASSTWYDHTGPVGASIGAMSDCPMGHTLHGPFTDQTSMLYRASPAGYGSWPSPTASRPWGHQSLLGRGLYNSIPLHRYWLQEDKEDFLFFLGQADEEKAPIWPSRRPDGPGGGWSWVSPQKTSTSRPTGPSRWSRCWATISRSGRVRPDPEDRAVGQGGGVAVPDPVARAVRAGDGRGHGLWDPGDAWRNGSVPEVTLTGRPALSSTRSRRWRPPSTGSANSTPT